MRMVSYSEVIGISFLFGFALGWLDIGQGPENTWWGLMYYLGDIF